MELFILKSDMFNYLMIVIVYSCFNVLIKLAKLQFNVHLKKIWGAPLHYQKNSIAYISSSEASHQNNC